MSESKTVRALEKEIDKLNERIKELEISNKEWRQKADSELNINAKLHTETAQLAKQIEEFEEIMQQLIWITEKAVTDDSEDTTIELAKQALKG